MNIPNQDTLGAALDLVVAGVQAGKYPFKDLEAFRYDWAVSGGVPYRTSLTKTFELETGKPKAKRYLSVSITRLDSGRYETVAYIS
jgi:hypothetical protein